ncbi:MAG: type IV pilus assembly protein PilM [Candidatus Omnitrophica bacterium]|nr:type IV pilus assembly protein PilM [Candidatus Omnitrophota bacterium]
MKKTGIAKKGFHVGIDIGTRVVKAIEISLENNIQRLTKFRLQEIDQPHTQTSATKALKALVEALNPATRDVNISVSAPSAIVRFIKMPRMKEDEIKKSVKFEAEKYIPFNINEVFIDAAVIKDEADEKQKEVQVILAAVKKTALESKLEMLKESGVNPIVVDIDSFACFNAFLNSLKEVDKSRSIALLNIGYTQTNVVISMGETPFFTRDVQIGTKDVAKTISAALQADENQAEKMIFDPQNKDPKEILEAAKQALNTLSDELRLSFGYYENQRARSIDEIYISGGLARLAGISEYIGENFGIKTVIWDPFSKFEISPEVNLKTLESAKSQLAVSVGLAIRG